MGIRKRIINFINASIEIDYLEKRIRDKHDIELRKNCLFGQNTRFSMKTSIDNLSHKRENIRIGNQVICKGQLLIFRYAGQIEIGDNVFIGEGARIWSGSELGIKIGNDVLISHNVFIGDTNSHEIDYLQRASSFIEMTTQGHPKINPGVETKPVVIEDNVWLSFNVIVMKGVTIGKGSIIGAGSIITKDIPPFSLVVGNPARILKSLINKE